MDRKTVLKLDCSYAVSKIIQLKSRDVSTLQEKNAKQETSKVLSTKSHEYFYSIAVFSVRFKTFNERKVPLQEEQIQRFVAPERSKMISLQDFRRIPVTVTVVRGRKILLLPSQNVGSD